ncbi:EAL domain-containing protein [Kordiimonas aquimaris]|uniref:EAL domain-containing protein n=1 Tax=Kordiimonas aquimaris TaxID=707591 RepID=UPI0021D399C1|nr:EAL domain-containing protein [Kordiimonas aquimaris]
MAMRFQSKLTLVYLALFLVVQGVVILSINRYVTENVREQIAGQLDASSRTIARLIRDRNDILGTRAQDLSKDFGFRQAVATLDDATIKSALANLIDRSDLDIAFVVDLDGQLIGSVGDMAVTDNATLLSDELIEAAEEQGVAARFIESNGELFEVVIAPVFAPVTIGWVGLGFQLDREIAIEFKELSPVAIDVAFIFGDKGQPELSAATTNVQDLAEFLAENPQVGLETEYESVFVDQDYMFRRVPLVSEFSQGRQMDALVYYSVDVGLQAFQSLIVTLLSILVVGLLLLILGSVAVSRGVTRPLRYIANAADRISRGEYIKVDAPSEDIEFARLSNSFNHMIEGIRDREASIRYHANHDIDTGLPNRNWFEEQISPSIDTKKPFSIAILELQGIADMRTVLTHDHINELVRSIAERLETVNVQYLARLSTETFVFAQFGEDDDDISAAMIINGFIDPFSAGTVMVDVRAFMGLTKFPADGDNLTTLLRRANAALDTSRTSAKSYAWYDRERDTAKQDHLSMMSDLRDGIKNEEVKFAYQPKLDLSTGKIASAEALVRWISPTRGFVAPDDFIPLAEKTGDVRYLTDWALKEAISQIAKWRGDGIDIMVAVNLSTNDLMNTNLPGAVLTLLTEYSVPPSSLKLEVTESAVMNDMSRALDVLNMLSSMGVVLSIDDYGTGYSSLSYIKELPVREIKIDKSFILKLAEDDEDKILVRSTIELAHNLGMEVTAEGVEDEQSVDLLREYGCDTLQGYHICRPVPVEEFEAFLKSHKENSQNI